MPSDFPTKRDPLRTGLFGIVLVVCLMLVSAGYTQLPFWPQGRAYEAYFANAAGVVAGNDVEVYGYRVGKVTSVDLVNHAARIGFTVDRKIRIGSQSLVAIKADTVLGQRSLAVTPAGDGSVTSIPLGRTTTPYTLNNAVQDLGRNAGGINNGRFTQALQVLTDALRDATPKLRAALDGVAALSRSVNTRDGQLSDLLGHAQSVSALLAKRAEQIDQLIVDGNTLFAALSQRRQQLATLISGIRDVARQLSGLVADNRREFGPALQKLNLVLDNLNARQDRIGEALKRLPQYATQLGEVVGSGPGFSVNTYGLPPMSIAGVLLDAVFQPGKLPESLADFLRGFIVDRATVKPQSP
ncbi:mammalian cell entry protein [Mycobacterium celatum]|uniref:Mammalian cell entry protein n=1 Tax=Mycobacterium celatum TaxID=28045 RepID=A0A1X1RTW9_MYCCE|nr:mammalian cell entry protein [Mycobacterium celatum]